MKFFSFLLTLGLSIGLVPALWAQTPALGPVYPVIEIDLLSIVKRYAKEEALNASSRIHDNQTLLKRWAQEPAGQSLPEALKSSRHRFEVSREALNVLGETYSREWLFINARNPLHLQTAKAFMREKEHVRRVILVSGSVYETQKALGQRVWFDQGGSLIKKLKIEKLPAWVEMSAHGITVTQRPVKDFLKEAGS